MKKYVRFTEENIPSILYHSTEEKYVNAILKEGLKTGRDGFIYLSEKPIKTRILTHTFQVTVPNKRELMDWREAWGEDMYDFGDKEYDPDNPYWLYLQKIPSKYLKLL